MRTHDQIMTAPAEEIARWESGDPQPSDLTEVHDSQGYLFVCDRFDGLWSHNGGVAKPWHVLLELFGPVTKYREVAR